MKRVIVVGSVALIVFAGLVTPALAAPPFEVYEEEWVAEYTIPAGTWCDFDIEVTSVVSWHQRDFYDKKTGELTRVKIRSSGTDSLTGPGATATGNYHWNVDFDATTGIEKQTGNHWSLQVPGLGVVFNESGNALYNYYTGEILKLSGPHPWILGEFDSLCNAIG